MGLLARNMYGTLGHSCSKDNWASSDGMMICNIFKTLFSFLVFGIVTLLAAITLDLRVRHDAKAGGYGMMRDVNDSKEDVKMDTLLRNRVEVHSRENSEVPYGIHDMRDTGAVQRRATEPEGWQKQNSHVRVDDFGHEPSYRTGYAGYHPTHFYDQTR